MPKSREYKYDSVIYPDRMNCSDPLLVRGILTAISVLTALTLLGVVISLVVLINGQTQSKDAILSQNTGFHADVIQSMIYLQDTVACNSQLAVRLQCLFAQRFYADNYGLFYDCNMTLANAPHPSQFPSCVAAERIKNNVLLESVDEINEYFEKSSFQNTEIGTVSEMWSSILSQTSSSSSSSSSDDDA